MFTFIYVGDSNPLLLRPGIFQKNWIYATIADVRGVASGSFTNNEITLITAWISNHV